MVARAQWAFQVLQGSVETLFRWDGKRLYRFIANLLRKPCIKCHENRPSFVWDMTKNILVSFFPDTLYNLNVYNWNNFSYNCSKQLVHTHHKHTCTFPICGDVPLRNYLLTARKQNHATTSLPVMKQKLVQGEEEMTEVEAWSCTCQH